MYMPLFAAIFARAIFLTHSHSGVACPSGLKEMYLGDNLIGDEGARALADGLRDENTTVAVMYLAATKLATRARARWRMGCARRR